MDQSDAGCTGIFSWWTNHRPALRGQHLEVRGDARVYSHDGPNGRRMHGYILMMDQTDAGCT
eukprot:300093-Prorocentrum_minimum.AAC.1